MAESEANEEAMAPTRPVTPSESKREFKSELRASYIRIKSLNERTSRSSSMRRVSWHLKVPMEDDRPQFDSFTRRSDREDTAKKSNFLDYGRETAFDTDIFEKYYGFDDADVSSHNPSYAKFKIPFEMVCKERYRKVYHHYEKQFQHEIDELINFQSSARDACYFVRMMSYTSFWPPLHNQAELKKTSKTFYRLSKPERVRLKFIMENDIS